MPGSSDRAAARRSDTLVLSPDFGTRASRVGGRISAVPAPAQTHLCRVAERNYLTSVRHTGCTAPTPWVRRALRRPTSRTRLGSARRAAGQAAGLLAGLASAAARARRGSVVSDPVASRTARQCFLAHLVPGEHPPQVLGDAGAREPRRGLELGFRDARSLTDERDNLLPVGFTLGRRARAPARTRPPGTAAPRLRLGALRLVGACRARRRPVGEGRVGLVKPFVSRASGRSSSSRVRSCARMESSRSVKRVALRWVAAASVSIQTRPQRPCCPV